MDQLPPVALPPLAALPKNLNHGQTAPNWVERNGSTALTGPSVISRCSKTWITITWSRTLWPQSYGSEKVALKKKQLQRLRVFVFYIIVVWFVFCDVKSLCTLRLQDEGSPSEKGCQQSIHTFQRSALQSCTHRKNKWHILTRAMLHSVNLTHLKCMENAVASPLVCYPAGADFQGPLGTLPFCT